MSKPKIALEDFRNKHWKTVCRDVEKNTLPLLMSKDWATVEAAKSVDSCGAEAGAAIIVAALCVQDWQPNRAAHKAIDIYRGVYKRAGMKGSPIFDDMMYWAAWVRDGSFDLKWPVKKLDLEDDNKWAGLANVILHLSARELINGSNSEMLAGHAIAKFLKIGVVKKRKRFGEE